MLRATKDSFEIHTIDHEAGGVTRLDMRSPWDFVDVPEHLISDEELFCDPSSGYVCAKDAYSVLWQDNIRWYTIGGDTMLAQHDGMLIEYDVRTLAPTGMCPDNLHMKICMTLTMFSSLRTFDTSFICALLVNANL